MATNFTPDQYKRIYAALPGPTPEQQAKYATDLATYNNNTKGIPPERIQAMANRGFGPPEPPRSDQQSKFTDWLGNGGNRLGYDWNGQQTPDTGFDGFLERTIPVATSIAAGFALGPAVAGAFGATAGGAAAGAIQGGISGATGAGLSGSNIVKGALGGALGGGITAGLTPTVASGLGLPATTLGRTVAGGIAGAGVGAVKGAVTGGSVGQSALQGGVSGALAQLGAPAVKQLIAQGVDPATAQAIVRSGAGAIGGGVSGGSSGALAGAIKGGVGSVVGSIFNNGSAAVQSPTNSSTYHMANNDSSALNDPNFFGASPGGGGTDYGYGSYSGNPAFGSGSAPTGGGNALDPNFFSAGGFTTDPNQAGYSQPGGAGGTGGYDPGATGGGNGGAGAGASSSIIGSLLSRFLPAGTDPKNAALLQQLLGLGSAGLGGFLQQNNARTAANQYARNAQYTPTNVSTTGGGATINPDGSATTTLAPGQAGVQSGLTGLANTALGNLNKTPDQAGGYTGVNNPLFNQFTATQNGTNGYNPQNFSFNAPNQTDPTQTYNDTFKTLQDQSRDSNNKFYQNNLDNQFANGVLSSTAGQYQSQAALDSINKQTQNNQLTARDFADRTVQQNLARNDQAYGQQLGVNNTNNQNQFSSVGVNNQNVQQALGNALGLFNTGHNANNNSQQNQLLALTGALQGNSDMERQQLARLFAGNQISASRGAINGNAYAPQIAPNSQSAWGDILSQLGINVLGNQNSSATPTKGTG